MNMLPNINGKHLMFVSDCHFGHKNIIEFERNQFKTIEEHDNYLIEQHKLWAEEINKLKIKGKETIFFNLGDFYNAELMSLYDDFNCIKVYVRGNHDGTKVMDAAQKYFDFVFNYPVFITEKIVISHQPVSVYDSCVNIHGHLHGEIIDKPNYITASINDIHYNPIREKQIQKVFSKIPNYETKFLRGPWVPDEKIVNRPQQDMILNPINNHIEIGATILNMRMLASEGKVDKRFQFNCPQYYQ